MIEILYRIFVVIGLMIPVMLACAAALVLANSDFENR